MSKPLLMWGVVLIVAVVAWVGWGTPQALAQRARVAQTWQTECWDAAGSLIPCDGTGQDGDIQAGVASPTPRFTDRGNGTVRDNLTGLMWLKDAHCFIGNPGVTWQDALNIANTLASLSCGLSDGSRPGDWRLPNIKELQSLIDFGQDHPALAAGYPFTNVPLGDFSCYWSSTTIEYLAVRAYVIRMDIGFVEGELKGNATRFVWPVRGGD